MEVITEAMLGAMLRRGVVHTIQLKPCINEGVVRKREAWEVFVGFTLPKALDTKTIFTPEGQHPHRMQPASLINRLVELSEAGEKEVWSMLVPHREAIKQHPSKARRVVSVDRFVKRLRELGACHPFVEIKIGDSP